MRIAHWTLIAYCTSLLVARGTELPPAEAAPDARLATISAPAALVTVNRSFSPSP